LVSTLVLALSMALASCSPSVGGGASGPAKVKKGGTFIVAAVGDPISFNPDAKIDDYAYPVNQNLYNKLVTLDYNYAIIPDLAERLPDISPDGKTYTFKLRKGVTWHDGKPFTSADVKWTLNTIIEKKGAAASNIAGIEKVETPDDQTVVVTLKEPSAPWLGFLAWYGTFIMPKHIYEGTDWLENPANMQPIGTGPFKFVEFKKADHVTLEANKGYFKGAPNVDKVIFAIIPDANTALQAFLNNEVDYMQTRPPLTEIKKLQSTSGVKCLLKPTPSRYYLTFNFNRKPFDDRRVRQAIQLAINNGEVAEKALKGIGAAAEFYYTPSIDWAVNKSAKIPAHNVQEAIRLLDEAGLKPDANGVRIKTNLPYFSGAEWSDMAAVIKENLKEIGVQVTLEELEIAAWMTKVIDKHDCGLTILNGFQGPDPDNLRLRVGTGGGINVLGYSNKEIDDALAAGKTKMVQAERAPYYFKAQELMAKDLPLAPIAEVAGIFPFKEYVKGMPIEEGLGKLTFNDYSLIWLNK
jgi:peptide/nickel transport system substrate-binding protein